MKAMNQSIDGERKTLGQIEIIMEIEEHWDQLEDRRRSIYYFCIHQKIVTSVECNQVNVNVLVMTCEGEIEKMKVVKDEVVINTFIIGKDWQVCIEEVT